MSSEAIAPAGGKGRSHAGEKMTGYPVTRTRRGGGGLLVLSLWQKEKKDIYSYLHLGE